MIVEPRRSWARVGRTVLGTTERVLRAARRREARRIRQHFAATLSWLGARDVSSLDADRRAARDEHLSALATYSLLGRFPRNVDQPDRFGPIFVDAEGRRCAMGHLIERAGGEDLVRRVRRTANLAYIAELANDAELVAWLDRAGLTVEEAARIQPSYDYSAAEVCFCASPFTSAVIYEATVEAIDVGSGDVTYRIDDVNGPGAVLEGEVVTGAAGEWVDVAIGERYLLTESLEPSYVFLDEQTVDTTACEQWSTPGVPDTAPAPSVIASLMGVVDCGLGLPPEWFCNTWGGGCHDSEYEEAVAAGSVSSAESSSAAEVSSSASTGVTSSSASVGAGGAASSVSSSTSSTSGAPGAGGGGGDGATEAPGAGSGGCSCGVAGGAASGETAFVLAAVIGGRWLRRRSSRARAGATARSRPQR